MLSRTGKDLIDMLLTNMSENCVEYFQPYLLNTLQLPEVICYLSELLCHRNANLTNIKMTIHNCFLLE